jgi:hypothetical protein
MWNLTKPRRLIGRVVIRRIQPSFDCPSPATFDVNGRAQAMLSQYRNGGHAARVVCSFGTK